MSRALYTPTYQSWQAMRQRCLNPRHAHYSNYGGRGITICPSWEDYDQFLADMGPRPTGKSLDRLNNNRGYCKSNCRWATRQEQNRRNSQNVVITYGGREQCLTAWCAELGLDFARTHARLKRLNWSVKDAFTLPPYARL